MMPFSVHDDDGGAAAQLGVVQIDGEEDDVVAASLRCAFQSAVGTTAFQRLPVAPEFEPGLGALLMGAGEVVLAGAVEEHAGAGLGGGAVEAEPRSNSRFIRLQSPTPPPTDIHRIIAKGYKLPYLSRGSNYAIFREMCRRRGNAVLHALHQSSLRRLGRRRYASTGTHPHVNLRSVAPSDLVGTGRVAGAVVQQDGTSLFSAVLLPTETEMEAAAPAWLAPSSCHVGSSAPRWQEDGARGAVPLDDGANHSGAPKRTISGISYDYKKTKFIPAQFSKTMKTSQLQYKGRKNRRNAQRRDNPVKYFGLKLSAEINKRPGVTQFDCIILTLPPPQQNTSHPYIHHPRILKCSAQK
uniref:Uncharacterized protein n=1 Tax=Oryza nivara TaxID=4536 RepID=A0A0E0GGT0_ORYNI